MNNPALTALMTYMQAKGVSRTSQGLKNKIAYEKNTAKHQSKKREERAEELFEQWDTFRTGSAQEGTVGKMRTSAGTALQGAAEFQRSMANNYLLTMMPRLAAGAVKGGTDLLQSAGLKSGVLSSIGSGAANIASGAGAIGHVTKTLQYINPMYAATMGAAKGIAGATTSMVGGNAALGNLIAGPLIGMAMPLLGKLTSSLATKLTGAGISRKKMRKLKPLSLSSNLHSASEFVDESVLQDTNQIISQVYALDPQGKNIDIIQIAQLNTLAKIAAFTSSVPILTSEFVNRFIKKDNSAAGIYNQSLAKNEKYYRGQEYSKVISKHAERMEHGEYAHTFSDNVGLAASEFGSFLNKMSIGTDLIKQLQIVLSGGNIKDEMKKFDKTFQTIEQRKASLFSKTMGIGDEESYANMYFSVTESSQGVLSKAKSFEDAQIGLLTGIYEFTRMTAVEAATIRIKAHGIDQPVKYNVIGKQDNEKGGLMDWLSNKIPFFETFRMLLSGARNVVATGAQMAAGSKNGLLNKVGNTTLKLVGGARVHAYHDDLYNSLAEGFDIRRESSVIERAAEPFIEKFNNFLLKTPVLRMFGDENRMGLLQRKKLEYGEKKEEDIKAILKEVGIEKLSDQQAYYKYATTSMPEQFDLMVHHLANISLFSHAIMINTANLAQATMGHGYTEKPLSKTERFVNRYTGQLVTNEEYHEFMDNAMNAGISKVFENAFESKKSWARLIDTFKYGSNEEAIAAEKEKLSKGFVQSAKHFFEKEKLTSESTWKHATKMLHKPLFTKDYLEELESNGEARGEVVRKKLDADKLLQLKNKFGTVEFAEENINTAGGSNNGIAANIFNKHKELCNCVTIATESWEIGADIFIEKIKRIALLKNKSGELPLATDVIGNLVKSKTSKDNTIEGVKAAEQDDILDAELLQSDYLHDIRENTTKMAKHFSLAEVNKHNQSTLSAAGGAGLGGLGSLVGDLFSNLLSKNMLKNVGKFALRGLGWLGRGAMGLLGGTTGAVLGAGTALAAGVYGAYSASFGREKDLIEKLDKAGVIQYNFWGDSKIIKYDEIAKMPLKMVTQLLSFDDWDDDDKKFLQELVDQKTKMNTVLDSERKKVLKKDDFNALVKKRKEEDRKKSGFWGYYLGKTVTGLAHGFGNVLTLGGLQKGVTLSDQKLYMQLEDADAIQYSLMPFVVSKIRDWDFITKLSADQLKSLLKLRWDDHDRKQLEYLYNTRIKQGKATEREQVRKYHEEHKTDKKALAKHAKMKAKDIVSELEDKGIVEHHYIGNSEIKDWDAVKKLDREQIKKLIEFDDWSDKDKEHLKNIYKAFNEKTITSKAALLRADNSDIQKNASKKQKNAVTTEASKNSIISRLIDDGVLEQTTGIDGTVSYNVKDWDQLKQLSDDELRVLANALPAGSSAKEKLDSILQSAKGKMIASEKSSKDQVNVLKSGVDKDELIADNTKDQNQEPGIFEALIEKLDQLINVTATGHSEQIRATTEVVKATKAKAVEKLHPPLYDK